MEVINHRAALLSNYEVLTLLRILESDHIAKTRTALRIKKEEEATGLSSAHQYLAPEEVFENLRTVEVEAIQYLAADYQPTHLQSEAGIAQLTKGLGSFELTKAEKLQIVNLAPTEAVELYAIVEELEDRLGDKMEDILSTVRASLKQLDVPMIGPGIGAIGDEGMDVAEESAQVEVYNEDWDYDNGEVFDDAGEGAGIEGDLDKEDDD